MKIHEYQAQSLFSEYGIPVPDGIMATTQQSAQEAAITLARYNPLLVKAQIHAGGRGKAGGIKLCNTAQEAGIAAGRMLGKYLITKQSGDKGKLVRKVLISQGIDIEREYYISMTMDRKENRLVLIASASGGMEIEEVAAHSPEKIVKQLIHPVIGLTDYACRDVARRIGLDWKLCGEFTALVIALYHLFVEKDCSLVEINPLAETKEHHLVAVDAKIDFDSNALYRHPELKCMYDPLEEDPREVEASRYHLNYIQLSGNIGCMVNGAGLAMATMDMIDAYGGCPANFLDIGGSASAETVTGAFHILLSDDTVKVILVNIFGGIIKCDVIAFGIVEAVKQTGLKVPLVVRLAGTNSTEGAKILSESGLNIQTAASLSEAAQKSIAALKG